MLSFRCIAVCSLGLWVCEELTQKNIHQQVKDAINVLGVTLKVSDTPRRVSSIAPCTVSLYSVIPADLRAQCTESSCTSFMSFVDRRSCSTN